VGAQLRAGGLGGESVDEARGEAEEAAQDVGVHAFPRGEMGGHAGKGAKVVRLLSR
jgi:hypothetical protein